MSFELSATRFVLLAAIALSLALMAMQVFQYPPLLAMPGGSAIVLETGILLLAYAAAIVRATNWPSRRIAIRVGTRVAAVTAAIQIAHLVSEDLLHLGARRQGLVALVSMAATFLIWGVAGYLGARISGQFASGAAAGAWSAIATMSIAVALGFALEFHLAVPEPEHVATWGEFKRSGWTDIRAFTIANTLDAALSHLVVGPLVGAIFGGVAGALASIPRRLKS